MIKTTFYFLLISFILLTKNSQAQPLTKNECGLMVVSDVGEYKKWMKNNPEFELIDLEGYIENIKLDIRYATDNNFTGQIIYSKPKAYVCKPVAVALKKIQSELNKKGLGLVVFDAYRPYEATVKFFKVYHDSTFVASPRKGSVHNRAAAVDVSLYNLRTGKYLKMPTEFDDFSEKASHKNKELSPHVLKNRALLKDIMTKYGFVHYEAEWWHYSFKSWIEFPVLDISFEDL